jgi:NADPH-dependent curcumin reductase CurA
MRGAVVAKVLASQSSQVQAGDIVTTSACGWREVAIVSEKQLDPPIKLTPTMQPTDLLGVLGLTGLTAYVGMKNIGMPKPGDTVVVSGAAGATGSVAGQIAKIAGARVIGTAGSEEKVKWLTDELGFDVALNYKDPDFKKKFKEATPKFIDVFWDNG